MDIRRQQTPKVIIELEEWEALDLARMLQRIKDQQFVGKSEFSMREKRTGRKILDGILGRKKRTTVENY